MRHLGRRPQNTWVGLHQLHFYCDGAGKEKYNKQFDGKCLDLIWVDSLIQLVAVTSKAQ